MSLVAFVWRSVVTAYTLVSLAVTTAMCSTEMAAHLSVPWRLTTDASTAALSLRLPANILDNPSK